MTFEKEVQIAEELARTVCPEQMVIEGITEVLLENEERMRQEAFEADDFMNEPN